MFFIISRLSSVLYDMKPLCCLIAFIRKQHIRMLFQPFHILSGIDNLKARRFILLYPCNKCRIFQITPYKDALINTGFLAYLSKYQGVFSRTPCIGCLFPLAFLFDVFHCLFHKGIQFFLWHRLFNVIKRILPVFIISNGLFSTEHSVSPFRKQPRR